MKKKTFKSITIAAAIISTIGITHASNLVAIISPSTVKYEITAPVLPGLINHPTGSNQTVNITKSMNYYDNGGPSGNYTGFNIAELIMIPPVGYTIKADVGFFQMNGNDALHISSGTNPYLSELHCQYTCAGSTITSSAPDGSLSFGYGGGPITSDGWEISITLVKL